jgi:hypothetical protein
MELPRPLKRRINETELTLHIIRASTPHNVKFNIFSRINRGGLPLTAQEIRNAIYPGEWRLNVRQLAESQQFRDATENRIKGERMEDLELVLRFIAHYKLSPEEKRPAEQNLDRFLNETIEKDSPKWKENDWADIEYAHGGTEKQILKVVREWLRPELDPKSVIIPSGAEILKRFELFQKDLPSICARLRWDPNNLEFVDYAYAVATWISAHPL